MSGTKDKKQATPIRTFGGGVLGLVAACSVINAYDEVGGGAGGSGGGDGGGGAGQGGAGLSGPVGSGGGPLTNCIASPLSDDFGANGLRSWWIDFADAGTSVGVDRGSLSIFLPGVGAFNNAGVITSDRYDMTDCDVQASVEAATYGFTFLAIVSDDKNYAAIGVRAGATLEATLVNASNTASQEMAYDPIAHRLLSLRESGGTLEYRTSVDGATWTTVFSFPTPSYLGDAHVWLAAQSAAVLEADATRFDDFTLSP